MIRIYAYNLALGYEGKVIISNINFSIEKNELLCIVGENGSGKSTLIKAILGINKPMSGNLQIIVDSGKPQIGYLSQQTSERKGFPATAKEIVMSGCLNRGKWNLFYKKEDKELADKNIELLGLNSIKNESFSNLSGGQQQRVLLARALCSTRDAIILDEPVAGLDPLITNELYSEVRKLKESGITIIMVSHDVKTVLEISDKILHIGHENSFFGTKEEYLKNKISQSFLEAVR